jgi:hypothetical protein
LEARRSQLKQSVKAVSKRVSKGVSKRVSKRAGKGVPSSKRKTQVDSGHQRREMD